MGKWRPLMLYLTFFLVFTGVVAGVYEFTPEMRKPIPHWIPLSYLAFSSFVLAYFGLVRLIECLGKQRTRHVPSF
jgi:hypothetical protein